MRLERIDKRPISLNEPRLGAFVCVRNERIRLPEFLDYHRSLGANRFFFIDNDSSDSTVEYLLAQQDVHVWHTSTSYAASDYGTAWLSNLLDEFAHDQWALILDADEFVVYPRCETIKLSGLCDYLDRIGSRVLRTMFLDMYSDRPVCETEYKTGQSILEICPYFDPSGYRLVETEMFGGVRERVFWQEASDTELPPCLTNYPLQRWRRGETLKTGRHKTGLPGAMINDVTGALLHFKFCQSFVRRAQEEVERKEFWNNASEWIRYVNAFTRVPNLNLFTERSVKYKNSRQVVDLGLMLSSESYRQFTQQAGDDESARQRNADGVYRPLLSRF
jgi:hypothetical protein